MHFYYTTVKIARWYSGLRYIRCTSGYWIQPPPQNHSIRPAPRQSRCKSLPKNRSVHSVRSVARENKDENDGTITESSRNEKIIPVFTPLAPPIKRWIRNDRNERNEKSEQGFDGETIGFNLSLDCILSVAHQECRPNAVGWIIGRSMLFLSRLHRLRLHFPVFSHEIMRFRRHGFIGLFPNSARWY